MNTLVKYLVFGIIVIVSLYNAVYFKPLDEIKARLDSKTFNAKAYAQAFMDNKAATLPAINTSDFLTDIAKDVIVYAEDKGHKLGISNDYYFIIQGDATVTNIGEENVTVTLKDSEQQINIAIDFIFGNAIREGAQMANIGDYQNTMDYNNISVELNNIVRETIVPPFLKQVKESDAVYFKGAVKVNTKHPNLDQLRVIPLVLSINP